MCDNVFDSWLLLIGRKSSKRWRVFEKSCFRISNKAGNSGDINISIIMVLLYVKMLKKQKSINKKLYIFLNKL